MKVLSSAYLKLLFYNLAWKKLLSTLPQLFAPCLTLVWTPNFSDVFFSIWPCAEFDSYSDLMIATRWLGSVISSNILQRRVHLMLLKALWQSINHKTTCVLNSRDFSMSYIQNLFTCGFTFNESCLFLRDLSVNKRFYSRMENLKHNITGMEHQWYYPIVTTFFLRPFLLWNKYRLNPFFWPLLGVRYSPEYT